MSHAPKQRALEAYADGVLSDVGSVRLERHLAGCRTCRETLAAIHAYRTLQREAEQEDVPELSWERLARALDGDAERPAATATAQRPNDKQQRSGRMIALVWPALAIAATVLIGWIGLSGSPKHDATVALVPKTQPAELAQRAQVTGWITLVSGAVYIESAGRREPVTLDTQVTTGSVLITEEHAQVHVALGAQTGFVLSESSTLTISTLRQGDTQLALRSGSVFNRVKKLASDERYDVTSGDFAASVRGTRFVVEQRQSFRVFVHEGAVAISRAGQQLTVLKPGEQYESPQPSKASAAPADLSPHAVDTALGQLRPVQLPESRELSTWLVEGTPVAGNAPLALRAPPGPMHVSYRDLRGQLRVLDLQVGEKGLAVEPVVLSKLLAPKEPTAGSLEAEQIRSVIAKAFDPLRRCYERSLKVAPGLEGKLKLAMRVAPDGHVVRADATGTGTAKLPPELARCIAQEASQLHFPKPEGGGPVSFEVPINLRSAR